VFFVLVACKPALRVRSRLFSWHRLRHLVEQKACCLAARTTTRPQAAHSTGESRRVESCCADRDVVRLGFFIEAIPVVDRLALALWWEQALLQK